MSELELEALKERQERISRWFEEYKTRRYGLDSAAGLSSSFTWMGSEYGRRRPSRAELKVLSTGSNLLRIARQEGDHKTALWAIESMKKGGWKLLEAGS
jgi:hypothetical protein